jgi:hypothetical protein
VGNLLSAVNTGLTFGIYRMKNSLEILGETSPKLAFVNVRDCAARITELETTLGSEPSKPTWNIVRANRRIAELESIVAERARAVALTKPVVIEKAAAPVVEKFGRERFNASCAADAAKKPKLQSHPELHGRSRFCAAVRVDGATQIVTGNSIPAALDENDAEKKKLTGRERFNASIVKDFANIKK